MNKKVLGVFVTLLAVAILTTPVMAKFATKEAVTATLGAISTYENRFVAGDLIELREGNSTGWVTLNLPGGTLQGIYYSEWVAMIRYRQNPPDPNAVGIFNVRLVWTFIGVNAKGTFEGTRQIKWIGEPPPRLYLETRIDLHGTGDFAGQTLKLSFEGEPSPPLVVSGYLLKPN